MAPGEFEAAGSMRCSASSATGKLPSSHALTLSPWFLDRLTNGAGSLERRDSNASCQRFRYQSRTSGPVRLPSGKVVNHSTRLVICRVSGWTRLPCLEPGLRCENAHRPLVDPSLLRFVEFSARCTTSSQFPARNDTGRSRCLGSSSQADGCLDVVVGAQTMTSRNHRRSHYLLQSMSDGLYRWSLGPVVAPGVGLVCSRPTRGLTPSGDSDHSPH